jgi:hypothetical protein
MTRMMAVVGLLSVTFLTVGFTVARVNQRPGGQDLARAVKEIEALNTLRSTLAASFSGKPDQSTFAQVCKPVGAQAKRLAEENGWVVAQMAERYRNPGNKLDSEALLAYKIMEDSPKLMGMWIRTEMDGVRGDRYFRRIVVEPACLACHGAKAGRPQFVVDGYPHDHAYGFEVGDLRGVYSVFMPD